MKNVNWKNPYSSKGSKWLKGNLHMHVDKSNGSPIKDMVRDYERRGFAFLAVTDNDVTNYKGLKTKLLMLQGIETDILGQKHTCIVGLKKNRIINKKNISFQELISDNEKAGNLCILCHPDWGIREHYFFDELNTNTRYDGLEIYNKVIERFAGSPLSTAKWDRLLALGKKVLGFVNQDAHLMTDIVDCGNVVAVDKSDPDKIFEALKTGCFYGFNGVEITDIGRKKNTIYIKTKNAKLIRFIGPGGKHLKKVKGKEAEIAFENKLYSYIRIECLGIGEEISWSQPFFRE